MSDSILYNGYQIRIAQYMTDGYIQKRTHKKNRINKKWRKRYGLKPAWDMKRIIVIGNCVYMSHGLYDKIVKMSKVERR